jgi:hypothetical protein
LHGQLALGRRTELRAVEPSHVLEQQFGVETRRLGRALEQRRRGMQYIGDSLSWIYSGHSQ